MKLLPEIAGTVRVWKPALGNAPAAWWWVRPRERTPHANPTLDSLEPLRVVHRVRVDHFAPTSVVDGVVDPGDSILTNVEWHLRPMRHR